MDQSRRIVSRPQKNGTDESPGNYKKKKNVWTIISSLFQKKLFAVFFPDTIHTGRPRVGVGIGLRIGFMAAYPETFLVILEPHAGHDDMSCFFHTRSLYVYLDAFE